jgi:hypothetical protein
MSLACALEWLRGPLMGIEGVLDMVASFFFQFQELKVRDLPKMSESPINCVVALANGWAVGDMAGHVGVYDLQCERLVCIYRHTNPVYAIANYGDDGFVCNATHGLWVWKNKKARKIPGVDLHVILKLVSFPDGVAASCSKADKTIRVYDLHAPYAATHSLMGPGRATDLVRCGDFLVSVHQTQEDPFNVAVWTWDARVGTHLQSLSLEFTWIGKVIATDHTIFFIDPQSFAHAFDLDTRAHRIFTKTEELCIIPDGRLLTHDESFHIVEATNAVIPDIDSRVGIDACFLLYVCTGHVLIWNSTRIQVWK